MLAFEFSYQGNGGCEEELAIWFLRKCLSSDVSQDDKKKLEEYQEEALDCETLVMATFLHPAFCLRFFAHCWPEIEQHRSHLLIFQFSSQFFGKQRARGLCQKYGPLSNTSCKGLKEYFNMVEGPFREISSSSCAAEKMFFSADNVCSSGCGMLKPRIIERFLNSHMWLKQGIQVTGKFEKAQNIFKNYVDFSQKNF
ncbi:hypothetical protein VP01_2413g4 [Puccinia sorghi]|uniref:HAT C-terminal dimerisation domain-containing protein n=1 Tax=Puccinia sorghi TaxID=27349 RepID=A0A0L6V8G7_9BASI|nr:hypothetical protein VP01_2413g4 [Puccinia sorghi]